MAWLTDVVFDAKHPASLARFWAGLLEGYEVRAYDEAELARLAAKGLDPESDPTVAVDGPGPTLFFQLSSQKKVGRNRVHLDTKTNTRSQEVERVRALGGTVRDVHDAFTVMLDPEGNEFCIFDSG